jgi:hypothetical protein
MINRLLKIQTRQIGALSALCASVALLFPVLTGPALADEMTGRQIMEAVSARHERPNEFSVEEMRLLDADGQEEETRTLRRFAKEFDDGLSKYLLTFDSPAGVRGVAMLTWETAEGEDDQWTFLPATKKLKRIVGGGKRSYFMGTDFANEDLVAEKLDRHRYERQADQDIEGVSHFVIWAFPETKAAKKSTGYSYREIFIRKDNLFQDKINFFERRTKKHMKTLTVLEASQIDGDGWRADKSLMYNHKEKHQTLSIIQSRDFKDEAISKAVFKHRYIKKKKHMK